MKEIETKAEIEQVVQKEQEQQAPEYVFGVQLHKGHTLFEVEVETLNIVPAQYESYFEIKNGEPIEKNELIMKKGHIYVAALNKKNVEKKLRKGHAGFKQIRP